MPLVLFLAFKILLGEKHFPLFQIQHILCNSVGKKISTVFFFINASILCYFEKLHGPCLATSVALSNNVNYIALLTSKWLISYVSIFSPFSAEQSLFLAISI